MWMCQLVYRVAQVVVCGLKEFRASENSIQMLAIPFVSYVIIHDFWLSQFEIMCIVKFDLIVQLET